MRFDAQPSRAQERWLLARKLSFMVRLPVFLTLIKTTHGQDSDSLLALIHNCIIMDNICHNLVRLDKNRRQSAVVWAKQFNPEVFAGT